MGGGTGKQTSRIRSKDERLTVDRPMAWALNQGVGHAGGRVEMTEDIMMPGDWCTSEGARRLKQKIEAYWRERGYDVDISLVEAGFMPAMRSARTDVRSDMVNGMPRRIARDEDSIQVRGRPNPQF